MVVLDSQPEAAMSLIMYLNSLLTLLSQAKHAGSQSQEEQRRCIVIPEQEYYVALTLDRERQEM